MASSVPSGPVLSTPMVSLPGVATGPGTPGGAQFRRLRRRTLVILAIVPIVLVGGGFAAYTALKPPTAESTVEEYFDELSDGDTAAALDLVSDASEYSPESHPLLVPKALSEADDRPSDLRILGTDIFSGAGRDVTSVRVSYKVRGDTVTQTILAAKGTDGEPAYVLHEPFLLLGVTSLAGRQLTVNGIAAELSTEDSTYVFPGAYTATAQGTPLIAGATTSAVVQSGGIEERAVAVADFGTPTMAPGAQAAVQTMVKEQITKCAQSTSGQPTGCPFSTYLFGSVESVTWTITAYPTVTVELSPYPSDDAQVAISSDAYDGVAHYVAKVTDPFGGGTETETGDVRFGVQGSATVEGGQITVSIS
ncbi:hypothetical protein E1264_40040 [Actinomadura sp. KC216]|uniref:hypothetical protein n=1 Tax=Actinomadura sp. KC216 TaxID=2530370 RepID=UPI00104FA4C5|nr:hypothetical protein [Actinomadura sp. KC216]TDB75297.1 hypothetical protein E1264_40040 [Actinomadura sp. KC216]